MGGCGRGCVFSGPKSGGSGTLCALSLFSSATQKAVHGSIHHHSLHRCVRRVHPHLHPHVDPRLPVSILPTTPAHKLICLLLLVSCLDARTHVSACSRMYLHAHTMCYRFDMCPHRADREPCVFVWGNMQVVCTHAHARTHACARIHTHSHSHSHTY